MEARVACLSAELQLHLKDLDGARKEIDLAEAIKAGVGVSYCVCAHVSY
jgi:hypothetical protein